MRSADAPPVPKGKVRQLYPPPDFEELPSPEVQTQTYDSVVFDEAGDEAESSVFISDAEELEDRRRRARERAEARRQAESAAEGEPKEANSEDTASHTFDAPSNESDEWPVF
jgi:hypothetical protein